MSQRVPAHRQVLQHLDEDQLPPSSEESAEDAEDVDASIEGQSVLGLSISRRQSRLASPATPAIERLAALEEGEHGHFDGTSDLKPDVAATSTQDGLSARRSDHPTLTINGPGTLKSTGPQALSPPALPSPWQSGPSYFQSIENVANGIFHNVSTMFTFRGITPFRKTSAPEPIAQDQLQQKRRASLHLPFRSRSRSRSTAAPRQQTVERHDVEDSAAGSTSTVSLSQQTQKNGSKESPCLRRAISHDPSLERSFSDTPSLVSLGDRSDWAHVTEMFNSRSQAIKDSFIDSNLRLPSLPAMKNLTHFTIPRPFSDFTHTSAGQDLAATDGSARSPLSSTMYQKEKSQSKLDTSMTPQSHFATALQDLTGDLVIMGGYRGSILRSAKAPHNQQWIPLKAGLNIRRVNLQVGLEPEDEETEEERIVPDGMLKNIGPIDISRRLLKRLRASKNAQEGRLRIHDWGYDWRLSPHLIARKLEAFLKALPCNAQGTPQHERGATVIAHSLGGLITRYVVNRDSTLFAGVVYAGVPQHCVNILGPIRNGDDVLLSSRVLTAQTNFTIRTTFALLPLDGKCFVDRDTKQEYPVDFFNAKTWEDLRLSPVIARPFPALANDTPAIANQGILSSLVDSVTNALPNVNARRQSVISAFSRRISGDAGKQSTSTSSSIPQSNTLNLDGASTEPLAPSLAGPDATGHHDPTTDSVSTHVTIPHDRAMTYLIRVLAETSAFKQSLAYKPSLASSYPPTAVLFGKSYPTVIGCRVAGYEGIKRADAYDDLSFASGDGVVLARAAMVPEGYETCKGGVVSSERGHIGLLGDLEGLGRCLNALVAERGARMAKVAGQI